MDGLPAVYFHSLVGSASWRDGVELLGYNRAINRERPPEDALTAALDEPGSPRARALAGFRALIRARAARPAFAPSAPRRAYHGGGPVVFIERGLVAAGSPAAQADPGRFAAAGDRPSGRSEAPAGRRDWPAARPGVVAPASCLVAVNCSARAVHAELPAAWRGAAAAYEPLTGRALSLPGDGCLELGPYQVLWLDRI